MNSLFCSTKRHDYQKSIDLLNRTIQWMKERLDECPPDCPNAVQNIPPERKLKLTIRQFAEDGVNPSLMISSIQPKDPIKPLKMIFMNQ